MRVRIVLATLSVLLLSACGFQLRGSYSLPFETLHIALPTTSDLHAVLKRNIEASTQTRVVDDPKTAQAILTVIQDVSQKNILSLNSAGRVREFQLMRTFAFRIHDNKNLDAVAPGRIVIQRDMTFSDSAVLSKEAEEVLIWKDIQTDLIQQLLRRLAAARPLPSETR
ncbi:hypothetical protein RHDC4_03047 [Rhodocyclaceae bacterium]|nr:hypothetical protein RHDC4_03047 [Rhodocyclaceae bacterium]